MNRRQILTATLPAAICATYFAGAQAAGAVPAIAGTETPVMALFREWQSAAEWLNGPDGDALSEPDYLCAFAALDNLQHCIMAEPAQGPADVLAKMLAWTHFGETDLLTKAHMPDLWAEARQMAAA